MSLLSRNNLHESSVCRSRCSSVGLEYAFGQTTPLPILHFLNGSNRDSALCCWFSALIATQVLASVSRRVGGPEDRNGVVANSAVQFRLFI